MEQQQYSLKVGFWNVNGFSEEKVSDDLLQNETRKHWILFLGETWQYKHNLDNLHHLLRYFNDFVYRKNFNKKGRPFGSILVHYRSELQGKVNSVYDKPSKNIIWIKINKGVNDEENNIFVACVYNSPKHSRYTKFYDSNVIDRLEQQLKSLPLQI